MKYRPLIDPILDIWSSILNPVLNLGGLTPPSPLSKRNILGGHITSHQAGCYAFSGDIIQMNINVATRVLIEVKIGVFYLYQGRKLITGNVNAPRLVISTGSEVAGGCSRKHVYVIIDRAEE